MYILLLASLWTYTEKQNRGSKSRRSMKLWRFFCILHQAKVEVRLNVLYVMSFRYYKISTMVYKIWLLSKIEQRYNDTIQKIKCSFRFFPCSAIDQHSNVMQRVPTEERDFG